MMSSTMSPPMEEINAPKLPHRITINVERIIRYTIMILIMLKRMYLNIKYPVNMSRLPPLKNRSFTIRNTQMIMARDIPPEIISCIIPGSSRT
jgi:hypothetical protein